MLHTTVSHDRDPAIIYSSDPAWKPYTGESTEFMLTTSSAERVGASAKITFTGFNISVFGTVSPANHTGGADPLTHYILDSDPPFPFRPLPNNNTQYNVKFYQSPANLPAGLHTLQIVLQSPGSYWLDCIVINGDSTISVMDNAALPVPAAVGDAHTHITLSEQPRTLFPAATTSPTPTPTPATSTVPSGAIIASGVLGGLLGILLLLCLLFFVYQRMISKRPNDAESTLTPYTTTSFESFAGRSFTQTETSDLNSQSTFLTQPRSKHRDGFLTRPNLGPPPVYYSPRILEENYLGRDL